MCAAVQFEVESSVVMVVNEIMEKKIGDGKKRGANWGEQETKALIATTSGNYSDPAMAHAKVGVNWPEFLSCGHRVGVR